MATKTKTKRKRKPRKVGTTVSYTLNVAASVKVAVRQAQIGRKKGRGTKARCVARTKRNAKARKCKRIVTLPGSFSRPGTAGKNSFRFTGRLAGRKLKPGKYTLVLTPSADGKAGAPVGTAFRIVK